MDALMEESDGMHLVVCHLVGDHLRFMFFHQDIHWSSWAIYKFVVLIISSSPSFTGNTRRLWQKFGYIYTMHLGRGLYNRYPCLSCKLNKNTYCIGRGLSARVNDSQYSSAESTEHTHLFYTEMEIFFFSFFKLYLYVNSNLLLPSFSPEINAISSNRIVLYYFSNGEIMTVLFITAITLPTFFFFITFIVIFIFTT